MVGYGKLELLFGDGYAFFDPSYSREGEAYEKRVASDQKCVGKLRR